jgi:ADP-heptose:LPS heptosyltransferase
MVTTTNRGIWKEEFSEKHLKPVTSQLLKKFGLSADNVQSVNTIEELRKNPPNIVVAESKKRFKFIQNFFKEQTLQKRGKYVMGLGVFQQLQYVNDSKQKLLVPAASRFKNIYRPYQGQELEDGDSILVFRTGGIGDLLFIQPNLRYLKEKYPNCIIRFACGPQYQPMVETWDCVDEMLDLPFTLNKLLSSTYHILFEGVIERCVQSHFDNAYNLFSQWIGLDLPDELLLPKQDAKPELVESALQQMKAWGLKEKDFVLMQLRASSPIRTPRHEFWIKIINELTKRGHNVVLTDNPRQASQVDDFINLCENKNMIFNYCQHSETIAHSIAITKLCKASLATDSAINHIAASLDVPCFGIYGPFPGHIRMKTYAKGSWVDAEKSCGPCFMHGQSPCKFAEDGYSPCYDELIETDEKLKDVIDKFEELVKND